MIEGEYESACAINAIVSNLVPKADGWGQYLEDTDMYFFLGDHHTMNLTTAPDPPTSY
jgi:protein-ribulosamine 3-kinase